MKITLSKRDVIWSYVGTLISMGSNLLILPFILYFLDDDMFGLWGIFSSIGAIAALFDCGFSVTFARNITYCWSGTNALKKEGVVYTKSTDVDFQLMKCVLLTCKRIYLILSSIAFLLMLSIGTAYVVHVARGINGFAHIIAWIIYATGAFLNLYYGYYASFLRGVGAVEQANINTIIARISQIILTIILLFGGWGIVGASVAYLAYGTIFRFLGMYKFYRYKDIGERIKEIKEKPNLDDQKEMLGIVWHNAWRDGAISVCNYLSNQAGTIICSMYLSLAETGAYSLGVQIASAIAQIAGALYNAYQPELQNAYICKDIPKTKRIMSVTVMTYIYLFAIGTVGILIIGMPLLRILRPSLAVNSSILLGLCLCQFMLKFRNCYTSYFSCTNRIIYLKGFTISSLLCVLFSLLFCGVYCMGVWGLIFAQIISQAIYNIWYWPWKAHRELKLSIPDMIVDGNVEILKLIRKCFDKRK